MRQDLDYNDFIERYLQGEMTPEEKMWFEKEIEGNMALYEEVKLRRQVDLVLSDKELVELKAQLEQIHMEIHEVTEKGRGAIRKIYHRVYYAAGALVMLIIGFSFYMYNRDFSNNKIIEAYYQPASANTTFRSGSAENDQLAKAMDYYKNHEYESAITLFEDILSKDPTKIGLNLYSGISHMEVKEYNAANESFQTIIQNQPNPFVESAKWYLGMCYIMTNKREKAAEQFKALADNKGFYQQDAKRILRRID